MVLIMDRNSSNNNSVGSLTATGGTAGYASVNGNGNNGGVGNCSNSSIIGGISTNNNNLNGMIITNGNGNGMMVEPSCNGVGALDGGNTILGLTMLMEQPVIEEIDDEYDQRANGNSTHWEYHNINLQRIPGYGFGIAVSGGRDNPHFANGDPSIAISDVLKGGPAEGKLCVNDRILSANGVNLENVDYAIAVQVLRDNSNVQLVIKRRAISQQSNIFKVSVSKGQRKEFAIPLCTQLVIKEARSSLQPGDIIMKINSSPAENLTVKEAKRLIESSKDKLELVIQRNQFINQTTSPFVNQNLYVQQPRRAEITPATSSFPSALPNVPRPSPPPPRPPLPALDVQDSIPIADANSSALTPYSGLGSQTRVIKFKKVQSLGIRLAGGNTSGIFVSAVQPNSAASLQNLQPGDKILSVNGQDLSTFTREEAVQLLLNIHEDVELVVDSKGGVVGGDCFYIKTLVDHSSSLKGELSFKKGEIFCVLDSLYGGTIGNWQVERMSNGEKGIVPNKTRLEDFMLAKGGIGMNTSFFKKKSAPIVYERVVFDRVPYTRPVVLLGVGSSIAKTRLTKEYPREFQALDNPTTTLSYTKIRISTIRSIINSNKHCLMNNITSPIEKLDQLYPIVVLLKTDDKNIIKELVGGSSSLSGKNNWKKLEKSWGTSIHAVLEIIDSNWCSELKEIIDQEQSKCTWIKEDDFKQQSSTLPNSSEPDYLILNHDSYISTTEASSATTPVNNNANNICSTFNDMKITLPDYNAPPPYALGSTNSMEKKIEIAKLSTIPIEKYAKPNYNFTPVMDNSYSMGNRNKVLAHTPPPIPPPESRHTRSPAKPPSVDRTKKPERKQFEETYSVFPEKNYSHHNGGSSFSYTKSLPNDHHHHSSGHPQSDINGNPTSAISLSPSPLLVPSIEQSYHSLTTMGNSPWRQQQHGGSHHHHNGNGSTSSQNNYDVMNNSSSTPTNYYQENGNRSGPNGYITKDNHNHHDTSSTVSSNNVYLTPPRPKSKPVPPPKPLKVSDLYSNTYLNVPRRRENSAFQLYNSSHNHRNSSNGSISNSNHNSSHNRKYAMLGQDDDAYENNRRRSPLPPPPPPDLGPPNIHTISKAFDRAGGNLALNGVFLEIPKGALKKKTEIAMEIIDPVSKDTFQSPIVAIKPEGLQFLRPVKLSLPHWMNSDVTSYLKITNNDLLDATEDNHFIHVLLNSI